MKTEDNSDVLIPEKEAAIILGISVSTLQQWRFHSRGPRYIKLGTKAIRYSRRHLFEYADSCAVVPNKR